MPGAHVGGMASKGLRGISYQVTRKVEASYNLSHTSKTLIGYTACCAFGILSQFFFYRFFQTILFKRASFIILLLIQHKFYHL